MSSSAQDQVFALFTVGHSVSGQVEASIVAGLYFLAFFSFLFQSPVCKRWDKIHAVASLCIFSAGQPRITASSAIKSSTAVRHCSLLRTRSLNTPDEVGCHAARGSGFLCRALAERHSTKARFQAYLILSSAATFLFIGALGDLLADW